MNFLNEIWVLASSSPRRQELFTQVVPQFITDVPNVEEDNAQEGSPSELVIRNARLKATAIALKHPHAYVLGSDTAVALEDKIYHKPKDMDDAWRMAEELAGNTHQVHTGICILCQEKNFVLQFSEVSEVTFLPFDQNRLAEYFSKINPLDKAGAYSIQEHREMIVESFAGSFSNIMGLPIERLRQELGLEHTV